MSKGYWRTNKRMMQFPPGNTIGNLVLKYLALWESRGYEEIPDELPPLLAQTARAPCYKAAALAILRNDPSLLGFSYHEGELANYLRREKSPQGSLF